MSVSFELLLASPVDIQNPADIPFDAPDTLITQILDPVTVAVLDTIVTGKAFEDSLADYDQPFFEGGEEGPFIYHVPENLVYTLANLDDDGLANSAHAWYNTEEIQGLEEVDERFIYGLLQDMCALAHQALRSDRALVLRCFL